MYERVVIDHEVCIGCQACVAVCPSEALFMNDENKATLIWEKCDDHFDCISVCPVDAISKTSEATDEAKNRDGWLTTELPESEHGQIDEWKQKYGVDAKTIQK